MTRFSCPSCKAILQATAEQAGKTIACPKCKTQMRLPASPPTAAGSPSRPTSTPLATPPSAPALAASATPASTPMPKTVLPIQAMPKTPFGNPPPIPVSVEPLITQSPPKQKSPPGRLVASGGSLPPVQSKSEEAVGETGGFSTWYRKQFGGLHIGVHVMMWFLWGYLWIPVLYLVRRIQSPAANRTTQTPAQTSKPAQAIAPSSQDNQGGQKQPAGATYSTLTAKWQRLTTPIKAAILAGTGFIFLSCFLCCGGVFSLAYQNVETAKKSLKDADSLWSSGKKAEATVKYKFVIDGLPSVIPDSDKPTVFQRVIDFGNRSTLREQ